MFPSHCNVEQQLRLSFVIFLYLLIRVFSNYRKQRVEAEADPDVTTKLTEESVLKKRVVTM